MDGRDPRPASARGEDSWRPKLSPEGPRYRALADAIAEAVETGELEPGERLPPVRDLAWALKVTPGTVARAYHLAENRNLIEGQVGRGTFVKGESRRAGTVAALFEKATPSPPLDPVGRDGAAPGVADLRLNCAIDIGQDAIITRAMESLIARHGALPLTDYHRYGDDEPERAAAAAWLAAGGLPDRPADTLISSGAQHALLTALAATAGGGDSVALTEPLIHPGLKDCARALGVRLEPVAADPDLGLDPDALEAAAARHRPSAIILSPNCQNPTLATMPLERRERIAEIALRRRIPIIEDDVYGWTQRSRPTSLAALAPCLTWHVASFSKCVAAGLRAGFLLCPLGEGPRASRLMQGYTQHVSWLISAVAAALIESGDAARIVDSVREETELRVAEFRALLAPQVAAQGGMLRLCDAAAFAWLELPEPWRASDFLTSCREAGVLVSPAEAFAVGRAPAPHAARIAFGACTRETMSLGLARLAGVLAAGPEPGAGGAIA